jgi:hypothetical protein
MKINRKEAGDTRFVDLDVGEVFNFGGPFMKVDAEDTAVNLQSGNLHHFPEDTLVHHLPNASLNLE